MYLTRKMAMIVCVISRRGLRISTLINNEWLWFNIILDCIWFIIFYSNDIRVHHQFIHKKVWSLMYFFHHPEAWVTNVFIYTVQNTKKFSHTMLTDTTCLSTTKTKTNQCVSVTGYFKTSLSSSHIEHDDCHNIRYFSLSASWSVWVTFSSLFNTVCI